MMQAFTKPVLFLALVFMPLAAAAQDERRPTVTVAEAVMSEVVEQVAVSGTLVAREEVLVNTQVNGYVIETINVDVGDAVEAGDVLAKLNDETLQAQFAQAEAEVNRADAAIRQAQSQIDSAEAAYKQANASLERNQRLNASGNLSQASLDQSIAAAAEASAAQASAWDGLTVASAQRQLAASQRSQAVLNLTRAEIKAAAAGVISARNAQIGAIASSGGEPMFRIIRDGEIEVEAEVIETALGTLSVNDQANFSVAGLGRIDGTVRLIPRTVDPVIRIGLVRVALADNPGLRIGLFASGWITSDRHEGLTVPTSAVLSNRDGSFVQVVTDGVVQRREVTAGLIWKDRREIMSGLEPGETVIARAGAFFRDGDHVTAIPEATE